MKHYRRPANPACFAGADMLDMEDAEGTIKLRLEAIEANKGHRCAKLTGSLDVTGIPVDEGQRGMKIRMAGDLVIFRSPEHRVDLSYELMDTVEISGEVGPHPGARMKMVVNGPMECHGTATVSKAD